MSSTPSLVSFPYQPKPSRPSNYHGMPLICRQICWTFPLALHFGLGTFRSRTIRARTSFILPHVFCDENNACFNAIEAGWTDLDCSKNSIILINKYVWMKKIVHPSSFAVNRTLFLSHNTCGIIKEVHPASYWAPFISLFFCGLGRPPQPRRIDAYG